MEVGFKNTPMTIFTTFRTGKCFPIKMYDFDYLFVIIQRIAHRRAQVGEYDDHQNDNAVYFNFPEDQFI